MPTPGQRPASARWQSVTVSLVLIAAMVVGSAVVAWSLTPPTPYDTYLPRDGQRSWVRTPDGDAQTEQALLHAAALGALGPVAEPVLAGLTGRDGAATTFLRTTINPSPDGPTSVWLAADASTLRLSIVSSPNLAFALVPGIELDRRGGTPPAEQHGTITLPDGPTPYTARVVTGAGASGCLTATVDVTPTGREALTLAATLCRDRGLTAFDAAHGGTRLSFSADGSDLTGAFTGDTTVSAPSWTDPGSFQPVVLDVQTSNAFGVHRITDRPVQARPALSDSGLLFVAGVHSSDVEAYRLEGDHLSLLWRVHPGGSIDALVAVGDLLVVATSNARLAAYRPDGTLAWTVELTEQVVDALLALGGAVSFATLDGGVWRVDASTGAVVWHQSLPNGINRPLVGDERFVLVADTAGGVYGWVPSGQQVFHGQVREPFTLLAINAEVNFLLRGRTIEGYEQQHSTFLWSGTLPELPNAACGIDGRAVIAMGSTSVGLDQATGRVVWTAPGAKDAQCAGTAVLLSADRSVAIVTGDGAIRPTVDLPQDVTTLTASGAVVGPDAAWLVLPDAVVRIG